MSTQKILDSDWSDYDDRKNRGTSDRNHFACTEPWEVDYLLNKIRKMYPSVSESDIKDAIATCCKEIAAPTPRKVFLECVTGRLGLK